jgi:hypothetical protein
MHRVHLGRAAATVLATLSAGCASGGVDPIDPFTARLEVGATHGERPKGHARAPADVGGVDDSGDRVSLDTDMELTSAIGLSAAADVRLDPDDEIRLDYLRFRDFDGHEHLDFPVRFAGLGFARGEHFHGGLDWDSVSLSLAHRVAAVRCEGAPDTDFLVRGGVRSDAFRVSVRDESGRGAHRSVHGVSPTLGVEARTALTDSMTLCLAADAGRWNHDGRDVSSGDVGVSIRQEITGPLYAVLAYEYARRWVAERRSGGGADELRIGSHLVTLGLGLQF